MTTGQSANLSRCRRGLSGDRPGWRHSCSAILNPRRFRAHDPGLGRIAFDLLAELADEDAQIMQVVAVAGPQTDVSNVRCVTTRPA